MRSKKPLFINKLAIAILIGSFVIAVGLIVQTIIQATLGAKENKANAEKTYENVTYVKINESPFLGDKNAPITVVEYTDFECPICKAVYDSILPQLKQDYISTGKVKFVFKSYPIEYLHKTSHQKTEAAFCARDQGGDRAFFQYYDSLFQKFGSPPISNIADELIGIAAQNGLDTAEFQSCLQSGKNKEIVDKEIVEAAVIGAYGTPTWLLGKSSQDGLTDTVKISGLMDYAVYQTIISHLLSQ